MLPLIPAKVISLGKNAIEWFLCFKGIDKMLEVGIEKGTKLVESASDKLSDWGDKMVKSGDGESKLGGLEWLLGGKKRNLKERIDKLDPEAKKRFLKDAENFDEQLLKAFNDHPNMLDAWKKADDLGFKLGKKVGEGGNKLVYSFEGSDDYVVAILKNGKPSSLISKEIDILNKLQKNGLPIIEILDSGPTTMIMKKYAQGSKDLVKTVKGKVKPVPGGNAKLLNSNSITDLTRIKAKLIEAKIQVNDLQFLFDKNGKVVIADPLDVYTNTKPNSKNLRTIDQLIELAKNNIDGKL